jgi:hypothetical protein
MRILIAGFGAGMLFVVSAIAFIGSIEINSIGLALLAMAYLGAGILCTLIAQNEINRRWPPK